MITAEKLLLKPGGMSSLKSRTHGGNLTLKISIYTARNVVQRPTVEKRFNRFGEREWL
jgi:hypothetical protein